MTLDSRDIIKRAIISEKSTNLYQGQNKYTFIVDIDANKSEIKKAVEELFKVTVTAVTTLKKKARRKRGGPAGIGRNSKAGYTPEQKKAVVTVKQGDRIEIFESFFG